MPPTNTPPIDINALLQILMQILTTPPEQPAGEISGGDTPFGPPGFAQTPDPMKGALMQILQQVQMAQSPQQGAMGAINGQQGGNMGHLGGRPRGS